jgi:2-phosphoglycolate phosphatase
MTAKFQAVLFDLDGTLVDTALDFTLAVNRILQEEDRTTCSLNQVRNQISQGALAIIQMAFQDISDTNHLLHLRNRMVEYYNDNIAVHSNWYPGINDLLLDLQQRQIPWGVVTNKPEVLAKKLIGSILSKDISPHSIIGGDTLAYAKPHPAPMKLAATQCHVQPEQCIYIGDHARDIEAAHAAGMFAVAASYGYLNSDDNPHQWGANIVIDTPNALKNWLSENV